MCGSILQLKLGIEKTLSILLVDIAAFFSCLDENCKQQLITKKRIRRAIDREDTFEGIHVTHSGNIGNPLFRLRYNDTQDNVSMEYQLKNNGEILKIRNTFAMAANKSQYLILYNSQVSLEILNFSGSFNNNCESEWYMREPQKLVNTCSTTVCNVGSSITSSPCKILTTWKLNVLGKVEAKVTMTSGNKKFELTIFIITYKNKLTVSYLPRTLDESCLPVLYEIGTNMSIFLNYERKSSEDDKLYINETLMKSTRNKQFFYFFSAAGTYKLKVTVNVGGTALTWRKTVTVGHYFNIVVNPKYETATVRTKENITFSLISPENKCAAINHKDLQWLLRDKNIGSSHIFSEVGGNSNSAELKVSGKTSIAPLYIQIYDAVTGFNISVTNNEICVNTAVNVIYTVLSGSAMKYYYKIGTNEFQEMSETKPFPDFRSAGTYEVTFKASNVVSQKTSIKKTFIVKELSTYFLLTSQYLLVGSSMQLKPIFFSSCGSYFYQWYINGSSYGWREGSEGSTPTFYDFNTAGVFNLTLEVLFHKNSTRAINSTYVYAIEEVTFSLMENSSAHVGKYKIFTTQTFNISLGFEYKWIYGVSETNWLYGVDQPKLNISFADEGYYNVSLFVKNKLSSGNHTTKVFVQYAVTNVKMRQNISVRVNTTFGINITFENRSVYQYRFHVADGKKLNEQKSLINATVYNFKYLYSEVGVYNIAFQIKDNIDTVSRNLKVTVLQDVPDFTITLRRTSITVGDYVTASTRKLLDAETISWHLGQQTSVAIAETDTFRKQFTKPGEYKIFAIVRNAISFFVAEVSLNVMPKQILELDLVAEVGKEKIHAPQQVNVSVDSVVRFTAIVKRTLANAELSVMYKWFYQNNIQRKAISDSFIFFFKKQGLHSVGVNVTLSTLTNYTKMTIVVQKALTSVTLFVYLNDSDTRLSNGSVITQHNVYINIRHIYFQPTTVIGVTGTLKCYQYFSNKTVDIFFTDSYSPEETKIFNVSFRKRIGSVFCSIDLRNELSRVHATYNYFIRSKPTIKFVSPRIYVKVNDTVLFKIKLHNMSVDVELEWLLNGNPIYDCSKMLPVSSDPIALCNVTFNSSKIFTLTVISKSSNLAVNSSHTVIVLMGITKVRLRPRHVKVGSTVNITALVITGNGNFTYKWENFNSTTNFITLFSLNETTKIMLTVSNAVSNISIRRRVFVYPDLDNTKIITNTHTVKTNVSVIFKSSLISALVVYRWEVIGSVVIQTNDSVILFFKKPGEYRVRLSVTTPVQSKSISVVISALNPIENVWIRPKNVKVGVMSNVTVHASGTDKSFSLPKFNTTNSWIYFNFVLPGRHHIDIIVSNAVSNISVTRSVFAYPNLDKIKIITNTHTVKTNLSVIFKSSLISVLVVYHWEVIGSDVIQTNDSVTLFFKKPGEYRVLLSVTTPVQSKSISVVVSAFDPIENVEILPVHVKADGISNITVHAKGTDQLYYWPQFHSNRSWISVNFTVPGRFNFTVIVSNTVSNITAAHQVTVYSMGDMFITASEKIHRNNSVESITIPSNTTVVFSVQKFDNYGMYTWKVSSLVGIELKEVNRSLSVYFNRSKVLNQYTVQFRATSPVYNITKQVTVYVYHPINNIRQTLYNRNLFFNTFYRLNITWEGTGTHRINISMTHVALLNFTQYPNFAEMYFKTTETSKNILLKIAACGEVNCRYRTWYFYTRPKVHASEVEPYPSQFYTSVHSKIKLVVKTASLNAKYTWYLERNNTKIKIAHGKASTFDLSHVTLNPGTYKVILTVSGPYIDGGFIEKSFVITVTAVEDCGEPKVEVGGGLVREHVKSKWFYSEVNVTSSCNKTTHRWEFQVGRNCQQNINRTSYNITLHGMMLIVNKPLLELPPRAFDIGDYCINHIVSYGKEGRVRLSISLSVTGTALVPAIVGGSFRVIGNTEDIKFDGTSTIDPDIPYLSEPVLTYKWDVSGACFSNSKNNSVSVWSPDNSVITLKKYCLQPELYYYFHLYVRRVASPDEIPVTTMQKVIIC